MWHMFVILEQRNIVFLKEKQMPHLVPLLRAVYATGIIDCLYGAYL